MALKNNNKKSKKKKKELPVPPKEFNEEILKSKKLGRLTNRAGQLILTLVTNYQNKNRNMKYDSEDIKMDVRSAAIHIICENWHTYDEKKYSNAFSYFTSITQNGLFEGMNMHMRNKRNVQYNYDRIF